MITHHKICYIFILIFLNVGYVINQDESTSIKTERNVLVLTNNNFDQAIKENKFLMVEFYAPWCGHCKNLAPIYEEVASILKFKKSKTSLAKIDASDSSTDQLKKKYGVLGFPTLKFFVNGEAKKYSGPRDTQGILKFIKQYDDFTIKQISNDEQLQQFIGDNIFTFQYFGKRYGFFFNHMIFSFKELDELSLSIDIPMASIIDKELQQKLNVEENTLYLINHIDNVNTTYSGSLQNLHELRHFAKNNQYVSISAPTENTQHKITSQYIPVLIYLQSAESLDQEIENNKNKQAIEYFCKKIFKQNWDEGKPHKIFCLYTPIISQIGKIMIENYGDSIININGPDRIVIFHVEAKQTNKYIYQQDQDINYDNLLQFYQDFLEEKLQKHIKSEPEPESNEDLIKTVVTTTFDQIIINNDKDVLVLFYDPDEEESLKFLQEEYIGVGEILGNNPNVTIAKYNIRLNERPRNVLVQTKPDIYIYKAADKQNPKQFRFKRNKQVLSSWFEGEQTHKTLEQLKKEDERRAKLEAREKAQKERIAEKKVKSAVFKGPKENEHNNNQKQDL